MDVLVLGLHRYLMRLRRVDYFYIYDNFRCLGQVGQGKSKGALPLQGKNLHKALVLTCIPPLQHFFSPRLHLYSPSLFIYYHLVNIGYIQTKWREEIRSSSCLASSWLSSFSLSSASAISPPLMASTLLSSLCVPLLPSSFTKQSIHLSPPVKPH